MAKYRKKPVVIEAFLWTAAINQTEDPDWIIEAIEKGTVKFVNTKGSVKMHIETLEGTMIASVGDYVIKGVNNEIYPCKPDIFQKTYELVES